MSEMADEKNEKLRADILLAAGMGKIDTEEMAAMLTVMETGCLLKPAPTDEMRVIGAEHILNVLDSEGNPLVAGQNYTLREKKVKLLREQFGGGNILDTYYRVYFLNEELEESFDVAEAKFVGGTFGRRIYQSEFKPIK